MNYYTQVAFKTDQLVMAICGYARVSTKDQNLASQDAQLRAAGCTKIYAEKVSGAWSDRPELAKLLKRLDHGDVLIVTRLDRLARSTRDLLNLLDAIGKSGAGFKSLSDAWADTTTMHGRLMLTVLGGLAEFERELIIARTGEGRTRAKARGAKFGRPTALTPHQRQEAIQRLAAGETQADVACTYNVDATTIGRLLGDRPFPGDVSPAALQ
jgi:DNA invertase Pin-like site-specific DNA recombinase